MRDHGRGSGEREEGAGLQQRVGEETSWGGQISFTGCSFTLPLSLLQIWGLACGASSAPRPGPTGDGAAELERTGRLRGEPDYSSPGHAQEGALCLKITWGGCIYHASEGWV